MRYKNDWDAAKEKWRNYWKHCNTGRPLMCVIARKPGVGDGELEKKKEYGGTTGILCQGNYYNMPAQLKCADTNDQYMNAARMVQRYHFFCRQHKFLAESFPNLSIDFGPGSLAAYLGCNLHFSADTVWTEPCWEALEEEAGLRFDPDNYWFQKHIELARQCAELAGNDFCIAIPDIMENMDALISLRGTMDLLMDLIDDPQLVETALEKLDALYYTYYDRFYDLVKDEEGGSAYTVFQIWGPGKTVKLQCDISAMISPDCFRRFAVPYLRSQAQKADCVLYHLDGTDAIRHLDAVLEIDEIDALQWTSGDNGPDGTYPQWDEIYEKALRAGKSIWVKVYSGEFDDWVRNTDRIVKKFGSHSLFLHYPEMSLTQAEKLLTYADANWSDITGSIFA